MIMISNAFDAKEDLCSITLSKFYKEPKMETLSIKFADKDIILKDHQKQISAAKDIDVVKKEHKDQGSVSSEVNESTAHKVRHKHRHEKSRHKHQNAKGSCRIQKLLQVVMYQMIVSFVLPKIMPLLSWVIMEQVVQQ